MRLARPPGLPAETAIFFVKNALRGLDLARPHLPAVVYPPAWWDYKGENTVGGTKAGYTPCYQGCGGLKKDCQSACMWFNDATQLDDGTATTVSTSDTDPLRTYCKAHTNAPQMFPNLIILLCV